MYPVIRTTNLRKTVGVWLMAALLLLAGAVSAATSDPSNTPKPKPTSLAPRHTGERTFGAPIQPTILHKGKKHGAPPSTPAKTAVRAAPARTSGGHKPAARKVATGKGATSKVPESKATADRTLPVDPAYRPSGADVPH